MVTIPEEVTRYLHAVTARVRDVCGDRVVGVYTTGSLALGGYRPGRSDIDVMAVVAGSPALEVRRQLAAELDHRLLTCPAAGLEFVLYPLGTVSRPTPDAGYLLNLNTGPRVAARDEFRPWRGSRVLVPDRPRHHPSKRCIAVRATGCRPLRSVALQQFTSSRDSLRRSARRPVARNAGR